MNTDNHFDTVEDSILAIRQGEMVIVADDEDRENEGDLVCAAEKVTPSIINFMAEKGRGLICLAMAPHLCDRLNLYQMTAHNTESQTTAFTISIDAHQKFGVTTGISASDRATTIQVAVAPDAVPADLRRPGHIFPLRARIGGVLERVGQTEASVDLARLAGLTPAGVICEILNPDGTMARRNDLFQFARAHHLKFITVSQIIAYRLRTERTVRQEAQATLPTHFGEFSVCAYVNLLDQSEHLALVKGDLNSPEGPMPWIRMHSECLTGDVMGSLRCDCGPQLETAMEMIASHGKGALVYLRNHEGRGIGLANKIKSYALQQQKGLDTVQANLDLGFAPDLRNYGVGAQILLDLGVKAFGLLTNNPRKIRGLDGYGLDIVERIAMPLSVNEHNQAYLETKRLKLGHLM
jgi:3,4-dihydroxy 2-butanone 4-phosphate synthase/GTP cyclohydrolase II